MKNSKFIILTVLSGVCFSAYARNDAGAAIFPAGTEAMTDTLASASDMRSGRGIVNAKSVFVPRGQWIFGGYVSYSTHKNNDYNFVVFENIRSDGYTFKINPMIGYAIKDNMALGARFVYSRSLLKLDGGELSLGDEESGVNISADYYYTLKHSYLAAAVWRQYIPLGQNKRLALFSEVSLAAGGHQTKFAAHSPVKGTYETGYEISLGVSPGLVAFVNNVMAVEINVGVMGLNYDRSRQVHNQVSTADVEKSYMNFNINLLTVNLGVVFYI